nr:hypothetical protein [Marinicella sp. W31]MDC2876144.1 hypothetical protein [Marinicella sp. W31]
MTSKHVPQSPIQRSGHGCIVDTPDGEYFMTHLMSRPLPESSAVFSVVKPRSRRLYLMPKAGHDWKMEEWRRRWR